jgi:hypothetical protein
MMIRILSVLGENYRRGKRRQAVEYEAFNYIGPSFFGLPTFVIAIVIVIVLTGLGGFIVWKFISSKRKPIIALSAWVLVGILLAITLTVHLTYPSATAQERDWNSKLTEKINDHYDLELSPEQFAYLNEVNEFPGEKIAYGPTLKIQVGEEPEEFKSLVLGKTSEKFHLMELIGADYIQLPES